MLLNSLILTSTKTANNKLPAGHVDFCGLSHFRFFALLEKEPIILVGVLISITQFAVWIRAKAKRIREKASGIVRLGLISCVT